MKITNIGGATAILEHKGKRILFDPWLNDGIFHGSWYHYPPLKMDISDLGKCDYVYISHIHEDHCAAGTTQHLNKDAEIILMEREPNYVAKFLDSHGFNFKKTHLIKAYTPVEIASGLIADMVTAEPEHELNYLIDSALVLKWDGFVLYDANDCPPYEAGLEYIRKTYKNVDLALLPYACGSGYPSCYVNLSEIEKLKEKERINRQGIQMFVDAIKSIRPKFAMPFADQYVVAGSRSHLNKYMAHPPCPGAVESVLESTDIKAKILLLNSAQSFNFDDMKRDPDEPYKYYSEADREAYIKSSLLDKSYDHEKISINSVVPIDRLVQYARNNLWKVQQKDSYYPAFFYYLDIPESRKRFQINLKNEFAKAVSWDAPLCQPYLKLSVPSTLMVFLLIGHVSWNIADAALFIDYERVPNIYDPKIHAFVNYLRV